MKLYEAIERELISIPHLVLKKIFNYKGLYFNIFQDISISTKISIARGGRIELGKVVHTRRNVEINATDGGVIKIGERTCLNSGDMIICKNRIEIGKNCSFGPNVMVYDHDHNYHLIDGLKNSKYISKPIIIGDNVWIGANTILLQGTILGNNCVVAAGSVVKGEFEENSIIIQKKDMEVKKYSFKSMENKNE